MPPIGSDNGSPKIRRAGGVPTLCGAIDALRTSCPSQRVGTPVLAMRVKISISIDPSTAPGPNGATKPLSASCCSQEDHRNFYPIHRIQDSMGRRNPIVPAQRGAQARLLPRKSPESRFGRWVARPVGIVDRPTQDVGDKSASLSIESIAASARCAGTTRGPRGQRKRDERHQTNLVSSSSR